MATVPGSGEVLTGPQVRALERIDRQGTVRGVGWQTVQAVVVRGFARPGSPCVLTDAGRQALHTGLSRAVVRAGALVWCRLAVLSCTVPEGGVLRVPVWAVYGPAGAHLMYRGRGCWWLRRAGWECRQALRVDHVGTRAALAEAAAFLVREGAGVFAQAKVATTSL